MVTRYFGWTAISSVVLSSGSYWGRLKLFVSSMAARHELLRGRDLTKLR